MASLCTCFCHLQAVVLDVECRGCTIYHGVTPHPRFAPGGALSSSIRRRCRRCLGVVLLWWLVQQEKRETDERRRRFRQQVNARLNSDIETLVFCIFIFSFVFLFSTSFFLRFFVRSVPSFLVLRSFPSSFSSCIPSARSLAFFLCGRFLRGFPADCFCSVCTELPWTPEPGRNGFGLKLCLTPEWTRTRNVFAVFRGVCGQLKVSFFLL